MICNGQLHSQFIERDIYSRTIINVCPYQKHHNDCTVKSRGAGYTTIEDILTLMAVPLGHGWQNCTHADEGLAFASVGFARWPQNAEHVYKCGYQHQPSMGPRPDGRGRPTLQWGRNLTVASSMGPRSDGRGTQSVVAPPRIMVPLQWGRGRVAAERQLVERPAYIP